MVVPFQVYALITQLVSQESQKSLSVSHFSQNRKQLTSDLAKNFVHNLRYFRTFHTSYFRTFHTSYGSGYLSIYLPSQLNYNAAIIAMDRASQLVQTTQNKLIIKKKFIMRNSPVRNSNVRISQVMVTCEFRQL